MALVNAADKSIFEFAIHDTMAHTNRCPIPIIIVALLFFAGVTVWTGTRLVRVCIDAIDMQDAQVVETTIKNIERRIESYGDGTREVMYVTYAFEFKGQQYEVCTSRIELFGVNNPAHYKYELLAEAFENNATIPCFVSPRRPTLSVFYREFSVGLFLGSAVFPLCFGAVSVIIIRAAYQQWRHRDREQKRA